MSNRKEMISQLWEIVGKLLNGKIRDCEIPASLLMEVVLELQTISKIDRDVLCGIMKVHLYPEPSANVRCDIGGYEETADKILELVGNKEPENVKT